jgi:hypothetical protein
VGYLKSEARANATKAFQAVEPYCAFLFAQLSLPAKDLLSMVLDLVHRHWCCAYQKRD